MEVHPPHEPIHTWRAFFIHLITITIGLLIALGLEGLVEQAHHRTLVKEARQDLREELQSNHGKLPQNLVAVRADEDRIAQDIKTLVSIRSREKKNNTSLDYHFEWKSFADSAWKTAGSSGALIYLDFESERDLADVYAMQDNLVSAGVVRIQRDHALAVAPFYVSQNPDKMTSEETQLCLQRSADLLMDLKTLEQLLVQLDQQYVQELDKLSKS